MEASSRPQIVRLSLAKGRTPKLRDAGQMADARENHSRGPEQLTACAFEEAANVTLVRHFQNAWYGDGEARIQIRKLMLLEAGMGDQLVVRGR